jgi:heat-inducible transcriptional repressor
MSDALTSRQTQILKSLIDEYIEMAEPVGSENLEKKYSMGVSPATIRSEMCALTKKGFLRQPHTSAGRVPSPKAMKFYIDQLMDEKQMSLAEEVKVKEEVMGAKSDIHRVLEEATHSLAQSTGSLALGAVDDEEKLWHAGFANVFSNPEFEDFTATASLFSFLEEVQRIHELFFQRMTGTSPVEVIFGEELGWPGFRPIGVVGTRFELMGKNCALGVIGPARLPYPKVIPVMRYFRDIFEGI